MLCSIPANNMMLQQRFHNLERQLWKRCQITLLQRNPGKLHERCHKVAAKRCMKTSPQHYGNIHFEWKQYLIFIYIYSFIKIVAIFMIYIFHIFIYYSLYLQLV